MYGDSILTTPHTVTGSIGVVGGWLFDKGLKKRLGVGHLERIGLVEYPRMPSAVSEGLRFLGSLAQGTFAPDNGPWGDYLRLQAQLNGRPLLLLPHGQFSLCVSH
jgi:hypothetical protein